MSHQAPTVTPVAPPAGAGTLGITREFLDKAETRPPMIAQLILMLAEHEGLVELEYIAQRNHLKRINDNAALFAPLFIPSENRPDVLRMQTTWVLGAGFDRLAELAGMELAALAAETDEQLVAQRARVLLRLYGKRDGVQGGQTLAERALLHGNLSLFRELCAWQHHLLPLALDEGERSVVDLLLAPGPERNRHAFWRDAIDVVAATFDPEAHPKIAYQTNMAYSRWVHSGSTMCVAAPDVLPLPLRLRLALQPGWLYPPLRSELWSMPLVSWRPLQVLDSDNVSQPGPYRMPLVAAMCGDPDLLLGGDDPEAACAFLRLCVQGHKTGRVDINAPIWPEPTFSFGDEHTLLQAVAGWRLLHWLVGAVSPCHPQVLRQALELGADPTLPDARGVTPLFIAQRLRQNDALTMMQAAAARAVVDTTVSRQVAPLRP